MVDAHCHLFEAKDVGAEVQRFKDIGGTAILCCGSDLESSRKSIELSEKYPDVYAAVGVHPESVTKVPESEDYLKIVKDKVIAIGECGLDYRSGMTAQEKEFQKDLLLFNIALAEKTKLPLVVHCRAAFEDLFKVLDYSKVQMHCFTGNIDQMQECVKRGWYISFGGILTFKSSHELREVAKQVPEDRLLIETDSPYLAPEPVRGTVNTPANVKIVAQTLASVRGTSVEEIDRITSANFAKLFSV